MYPRTDSGADDFDEDLLVLDLDMLPSGYGWLFPQGEFHNVGVGAPVLIMKNLRRWLARALSLFGLHDQRPEGSHPCLPEESHAN